MRSYRGIRRSCMRRSDNSHGKTRPLAKSSNLRLAEGHAVCRPDRRGPGATSAGLKENQTETTSSAWERWLGHDFRLDKMRPKEENSIQCKPSTDEVPA